MTQHTGVIERKALLQYSLLAMPLAFAGMPLYVHTPDYYATEFGISLSVIGFVLLGLRFFDAIQDPIIGRLSDRYARHRHSIIIVSAAVFGRWVWCVVSAVFSCDLMVRCLYVTRDHCLQCA